MKSKEAKTVTIDVKVNVGACLWALVWLIAMIAI